jgi:hypothetical protein
VVRFTDFYVGTKKMVNFADKRIIANSICDILELYINQHSVVVTAHDGSQVIDHGSGTLFNIEGTYLILTAAHVIKNYAEGDIDIIGTYAPSSVRVAPIRKRYWGGSMFDKLDVAYLVLPEECISLFGHESFLTLDAMELYPEQLPKDLTVFFGFPDVQHDRPRERHERFQPFMYVAGIEDDIDWSQEWQRPTQIKMEYPHTVLDARTRMEAVLPDPSGMSGGGIWRSNINRVPVSVPWTASNAKLIGIGTDWLEAKEAITANRIEVAVHLLAEEFRSAGELT